MAFDPATALLELGKTAIDKLWPNAEKRAEEFFKLQQLAQTGDLAQLNAHVQLMLGQMEINKEEAKSGSLFVAGGRPAIIWVGAVALAMAYIPKALVVTIMWGLQCWAMIKHGQYTTLPIFPDLGLMDILGLLGSILGVGGLRSFDKFNGVQTDSVKKGL